MPGEGANTWLSLLWVLVCVVAILALAYWFTKYAARGFPSVRDLGGSEQLKVLSRLALGREESLALVRAGERYFLLGITPTGISNLAEFSAGEAECWLKAQQAQPATPSFREAVQTVLEQRKREKKQR